MKLTNFLDNRWSRMNTTMSHMSFEEAFYLRLLESIIVLGFWRHNKPPTSHMQTRVMSEQLRHILVVWSHRRSSVYSTSWLSVFHISGNVQLHDRVFCAVSFNSALTLLETAYFTSKPILLTQNIDINSQK